MGKDGEADINQSSTSDRLPNSFAGNSTTTMDGPSQSTTSNTTPTTDTDNTNMVENIAKFDNSSKLLSSADTRLKELESLFLAGPNGNFGPCHSIETLLDVLLVLYDECINSSMRREKTVSDFIEYGKQSTDMFAIYCLIHQF